jgi:MYXO-CTERM domain-containing protein
MAYHRVEASMVLAVTLATLGWVATARPAAGEITLEIGVVEAGPGERVAVPVTLHSDGAAISVFQNDLLFEPQTGPVTRNDRPACAAGPALPATVAGARFSAPICVGAECGAIRAEVGASGAALPDDAVMYACDVQVEADAAFGSYAVRCANLFTSDSFGNELGGTCTDGGVVVVDRPVPTPTAPPVTVEPTPAPTGSPGSGPPVVEVGSATGNPGDRVTLEVRLHPGAAEVSGIQADIGFAPATAFARAPTGRPDCAYGTDPSVAGFSSLGFQPPLCTDDCRAIRAIVLSTDLEHALPEGTLLLTCTIEIAADAEPGTYPLSLSNLGASTPEGMWLDLDGVAGAITVVSAGGENQFPSTGGSGGATSAGGGCAVADAPAGRGWGALLAGLVALALIRRRARS